MTDLNYSARLFNEGADSRLAGIPVRECPYTGDDRNSWLYGWLDVNHNWGKRVLGRWFCKQLPPLRTS